MPKSRRSGRVVPDPILQRPKRVVALTIAEVPDAFRWDTDLLRHDDLVLLVYALAAMVGAAQFHGVPIELQALRVLHDRMRFFRLPIPKAPPR